MNCLILFSLLSVFGLLLATCLPLNFATGTQTLTNSYNNQKCNISMNYPSDWRFEEIDYDTGNVLNFIVELEPNNEEGFNNVVGVELLDISSLSDRSFEGIKDFEEQTLSDLSEIVKTETSEPTQIAGYPAQKIVQSELVSGDKKMEVFTVAFDKNIKLHMMQH